MSHSRFCLLAKRHRPGDWLCFRTFSLPSSMLLALMFKPLKSEALNPLKSLPLCGLQNDHEDNKQMILKSTQKRPETLKAAVLKLSRTPNDYVHVDCIYCT